MIDWKTKDLRNMGMEIPQHTQETLENYLLRGWAPGGFVESMLAHDYERAFASADTANRQMMWAIWRWISESSPPQCHSSYQAIEMWRDDLDGRRSHWVRECEKEFIWRKLGEKA